MALTAAFSCQKEDQKKDEDPDVIPSVTLTTLADKGVTEADGFKVFAVEATNTTGDVFNAEFVSNLTFIPAGEYTCSASAANYTYRNASINGKGVTSGSISVTKDEDNYTFKGLVYQGGDLIEFSASGTLVYTVTVDPEHKIYFAGENNDTYGGKVWMAYILDDELQTEGQICVCNATDSATPEGTYSVVELANMTLGAAMEGLDYSSFGFGKLGCYFVDGGTEYYVKTGTVEIVEEFGYLSVKLTNITVENGSQTSWSALYCETIDEMPSSGFPEEINFSFSYYSATPGEPNAETGTTEYTFSFNSIGEDYMPADFQGQIVFSVPTGTDLSDPTGAYDGSQVSMGMDLTAWGYEGVVIGTYIVYEGVNYMLYSAESLNVNVTEDMTSNVFELVNPVIYDTDGNSYQMDAVRFLCTMKSPF